MLFEIEKIQSGIVIKLNQSRVDMAISRKFRDELSEAIVTKPALVVIDLTATEYFDSSALGTLVSFQRDVKSYGGVIHLSSLGQTLETLMKLSKLDAMFKIYGTLEEAIK